MRTLTLKNVPDELYARLREAADNHRRSLNSEVLVAIERSLQARKLDVEEVLARARVVRRKTAHAPATMAEITDARAAGRP
jgi:plasmid stability protein